MRHLYARAGYGQVTVRVWRIRVRVMRGFPRRFNSYTATRPDLHIGFRIGTVRLTVEWSKP